MKNIVEIKNYLTKEIDQNELLNKNHKKVLASVVTGCISVFDFASLLVIPIGITSSAIGLNICAITAKINRYKSIIKKNRKKHHKIAF